MNQKACENRILELELRVKELSRDPVTGVRSRHALNDAFGTEFARCRDGFHRTGVMMIDIDHLKKLNDTYGHAVGDEALHRVAGVIQRCVRANDVVVRYGGDEFCVLVSRTDPAGLLYLARRILRVTARLNLSVSIGVTLTRDGDTQATVLARADAALYTAKKDGRNRVQGDVGTVCHA